MLNLRVFIGWFDYLFELVIMVRGMRIFIGRFGFLGLFFVLGVGLVFKFLVLIDEGKMGLIIRRMNVV